jgi:hypothetical protein
VAELRRGRPGPQHVGVIDAVATGTSACTKLRRCRRWSARAAGSSSPALATAWPAKPTTRFLRLWEVEIKNVPSGLGPIDVSATVAHRRLGADGRFGNAYQAIRGADRSSKGMRGTSEKTAAVMHPRA